MRHEGLDLLAKIVEAVGVVDHISAHGDVVILIVLRVSSANRSSQHLDQELELDMSTKHTASPIAYARETKDV
jgi:hypothetical protein